MGEYMAEYTGWSCPAGPAELVDFLVDRGKEVAYETFAANVDLDTAEFLEPWQIEMLPTDYSVTFLRTELPHGEEAWVLQHGGIEFAFVEPGIDFWRAPMVIGPLTEKMDEIYEGWADSWSRADIDAALN
jgi:hypothetical protein